MKNLFQKYSAELVFVTICLITMFCLSSCASTQCYNVGTGKPMTKTCGGGWTGGQ